MHNRVMADDEITCQVVTLERDPKKSGKKRLNLQCMRTFPEPNDDFEIKDVCT